MEKVRVELGERSYNIFIGSGILDGIGKRVERFGFSKRLAIISNPTVYKLYGQRVTDSLKHEGFDVFDVVIPDGEKYKDFNRVYIILTELLRKGLDRKSAVVALGGGVIGDMACFAASIYMRGIPCIQVPTTLLSQVDSSVGGKTGVNHELGKNMIGTFYQPSLVWIDTEVLETLPEREVSAGFSEIIKYGVIRDPELFRLLSMNSHKIKSFDAEMLSYIVKRSCEIKADIVSEDERESGVRAILNFGHSVGHAIETLTGYEKYIHGEAVAIGMCYEAELARVAGLAGREVVTDICGLVKEYGLPARIPDGIDGASIIDTMQIDKKTINGRLRIVLPESIGSVAIREDIKGSWLEETLKFRP